MEEGVEEEVEEEDLDQSQKPDFVEEILLNIYHSIPKELQNFLTDSQNIFSYSKKNSLPLWWTYSNIWKELVRSGSAKLIMSMMWPLLLELCERQVDILAIQQFPSCMVSPTCFKSEKYQVIGLACGGIPVFGELAFVLLTG
jgi:hypothetical protein